VCKALTSRIWRVRRSQCSSVITILFHPCCPPIFLHSVFTHMLRGKFILFTYWEFNSHRISMGHQHCRRFVVEGHQYGCRDVIWKHLHVACSSTLRKYHIHSCFNLKAIFMYFVHRTWYSVPSQLFWATLLSRIMDFFFYIQSSLRLRPPLLGVFQNTKSFQVSH